MFKAKPKFTPQLIFEQKPPSTNNRLRQRLLIAGILALGILLWQTIVIACTQPYSPSTPIFLSFDDLRAPIISKPASTINKNGKIVLFNNYLLVNEPSKGIHVFDNQNPETPIAISFIPIVGNLDIVIKDSTLYADSYTDLVMLDISDMENIQYLNRLAGAFEPKYMNEYYGYQPEDGVIIDFEWGNY